MNTERRRRIQLRNAPLLIMWAMFHQNGKLLAWAIVELPKLLSEGEGVEGDG